MWRRAGWAYVGLLHVLLAVLVFKTNFLELAAKTIWGTPQVEWSEDIYRGIAEQAALDGATPPGAVLLLGDSIMSQVPPGSVGAGVRNFGINGDTTAILRLRLATLRSLATARAAVFAVGVNDLKFRPQEEIVANYAALLAAVPERVGVVVVSVLPVDEAVERIRRRPDLRNAAIAALNARLQPMCAQRAGCRYLDAWPGMSDPVRGGLAVAWHAGDGWHLSPRGAVRLGEIIAVALPR